MSSLFLTLSPLSFFCLGALICLGGAILKLWYEDKQSGKLNILQSVFIAVSFPISFGLAYGLYGWTLETALLRLIYGCVTILVMRWLTSLAHSSEFVSEIFQDQATIANHWKNDTDLVVLTAVLRIFRVFAIGLFGLGVYLFPVGLDAIFPDFLGDPVSLTAFWMTAGPLCIGIATVLWFTVEIIQLIATIHVILYRNHLTTHKMLAICAECVKSGSFAAGGFAAAGAGVLQVSSSCPWVETTSFGNSWQIYSPTGRGYGFEDAVVFQQHNILKRGPNYDPFALANEHGIITHDAVEAYVKQNGSETCRSTSVGQRQALNIRPSLGGLLKSYLPEGPKK